MLRITAAANVKSTGIQDCTASLAFQWTVGSSAIIHNVIRCIIKSINKN